MQHERSPIITLWENPAWVILLSFLAFSFFMGVGSVLAAQVSALLGVDIMAVLSGESEIALGPEERQAIRWANMVSHLIIFTLTSVLMAGLIKDRGTLANFFRLDRFPGGILLGWAILTLLLGLPGIQLINWLNLQIPLPETLQLLENQQGSQLQVLIQMESLREFLTTFLIAAIVPAVGEELFFRGLLQPQFQKWFSSPIVAIWCTAFLFSAVHMQFAGFFPRFMLGAFLGYLLYWSGSLWLPILAHLVFNGLQIAVSYWKPDLFEEAEEVVFGWTEAGIGLVSLALVFLLLPKIRDAGWRTTDLV
ncbi:MAG: type II CAAX endopeptidase family protein [Bacteroidota bacterium]